MCSDSAIQRSSHMLIWAEEILALFRDGLKSPFFVLFSSYCEMIAHGVGPFLSFINV